MNNNSIRIIEAILTAKKFIDRDDVISTGRMLVKMVQKGGGITAETENAYLYALSKLETLTFGEMTQIIEYIESGGSIQNEDNGVSDDDPKGERIYAAGMKHYDNMEYALAAQLFRSAADKRYPKAIYNFALCLYSGIGVREDKVSAIKLFVQASALGVPEAEGILRFIAYENEQAMELLGK